MTASRDSWEIDEPGYFFGDIFENLLAGTLDSSNAIPEGLSGDVSLGLGFELGTLELGDSWGGSFQISLSDIGGLSHSDPDSAFQYYFNGNVEVFRNDPASVPEPPTLLMLTAGLGIAAFRSVARPDPLKPPRSSLAQRLRSPPARGVPALFAMLRSAARWNPDPGRRTASGRAASH